MLKYLTPPENHEVYQQIKFFSYLCIHCKDNGQEELKLASVFLSITES